MCGNRLKTMDGPKKKTFCLVLVVAVILVLASVFVAVQFGYLTPYLTKECVGTGSEEVDSELTTLLTTDTDGKHEFEKHCSEAKQQWRINFKGYFGKEPRNAVKFFLYDDPGNVSDAKRIHFGSDASIQKIQVPHDTTLKILIHGFMNHVNKSFNRNLTRAYLENTNSPVLVIDWSEMAGRWEEDGVGLKPILDPLLYFGIVKMNVPEVAKYVSECVAKLKNLGVVDSFSQVHLVGHSLGAQISGRVGARIQEEFPGEKIGRITGLDPAGPKFREKSNERRLDKEDAEFVDIYHTSHTLGDRTPNGHVDFYPNSDTMPQPGCKKEKPGFFAKLKSIFGYYSYKSFRCSHHRAIDYFVKSITDKSHYGCSFQDESEDPKADLRDCTDNCDRNVVFGEYLSPASSEGMYCLHITLDGNDDDSPQSSPDEPVSQVSA